MLAGKRWTGRSIGLECTLLELGVVEPFKLNGAIEAVERAIGERGTMAIGEDERECRSGWEAGVEPEGVVVEVERVTAGDTARRFVGWE